MEKPITVLPEEDLREKDNFEENENKILRLSKEDSVFDDEEKSLNTKDKILDFTKKKEVIAFINSCSSDDFYNFLENLQEMNWYKNIIDKNKIPEEIIEKIIEKSANIFWMENFTDERKSAYTDLMSWLYNDLQKYEKLLIKHLDFKNNKKNLNTEIFLHFIQDLYHSDSEYGIHGNNSGYTSGGKGSLPEIEKYLEKSIKEKNASYFLLLHAKEVYEDITTKYYLFEDDEELIKEIKNKYGDKWQEELEERENRRNSESHSLAEHSEDQRPFLIAPKIFANIDNAGDLSISNPKDFYEINNLLKKFIQASENEMEPQGNGIWELNNKTYDEATKLKNDLAYFFNQKLDAKKLMLERKNKNEKESGAEQQNFKDYNYLIRKNIREKIENEFSLKLSTLTFREQFYFLQLIKNKKESEIEPVKEFVKKYKIAGIKTFLSLEHGGQEMGDKILSIGENLKQPHADLIFTKYAELVDLSNKTQEDLKDHLTKENINISKEELKILSEEVLKKAANFLVEFSEKLKSPRPPKPETGIDDMDLILNHLADYKSELILNASLFKSLSKDRHISPEDLKGINYGEETAGELTGGAGSSVKKIYEIFKKHSEDGSMTVSAEDLHGLPPEKASEIWQMFKFYKENWKDYPALGNNLLEGFASRLAKGEEGTKLYKYKQDKNILAFLRIDDLGNGKKYFGSFNALPNLKGFAIGTALLEKVLEKEGKNSTIEAVCAPKEHISSVYVDRFGFVINGVHIDYNDTGEPILKIKREENTRHYYSDYNKEEITREHKLNFSGNKYKEGEKFIVLKFKKNSPELISVIDKLTNNGEYIISKYLFEGDGDEEVYCAFEKMK